MKKKIIIIITCLILIGSIVAFILLNDKSVFKSIDREVKEGDNDLSIRIGDINGNPDVSMVTTTFKMNDGDESTITLLGPTRMDYDKALSALEYLSEELSKYFNDLNGGGNNGGEA